MSISHSIVKKHGGAVTVESEVGCGTTLHIYLPAVETQAVENASEKSTESKIPIFGNGRILIMDDEKMIRKLAGEIITYLGYDVEFAQNGSEAVERYKNAVEAETPYDAVIMDLTVRGAMGAEEAIKKLLETDPQVNAILSSGYSTDRVIKDYEQYGFRGFIAKPYTLEELGDTLDRVLNPVS